MHKSSAILVAIAITLSLVATEVLISYLFPSYDIGGFLLILFLLVGVPVGVGIVGFIVLRGTKGKVRIILTIVGLVIATFLIQISLHPSHTNPWTEIYRYSAVLGKYPDGITYEDLSFGNEQEQVAASYKYRDSLPDRIATIEIGNKGSHISKEKYFIELKDAIVSYDINKISLVEDNGYLIIVTNPGIADRNEYKLKGWNIDFIFHLYQGAWIPFGDEWLSQSAHDFKLSTGAEKLFYKILALK